MNGYSIDYDQSLLTTGVAADLIILIGYDDTLSQIQFAFPKIIQKNSDNRPVVGIVRFHKSFGLSEKTKEVNIKEYLKYLFLHEFTHILGFMQEYLENNTIIENEKVYIHRINTNNDIQKLVIKSENVRACAEEYFNCEDMPYLEIEEQESKFEKGVV